MFVTVTLFNNCILNKSTLTYPSSMGECGSGVGAI